MKLTLLLGGLSIASAQSLDSFSSSSSSGLLSSLSSSLSPSSRNVSSSAATGSSSTSATLTSASTSSSLTSSSRSSSQSNLSSSPRSSLPPTVSATVTAFLNGAVLGFLNATNSASNSPKPTAYTNPWAGNFSGPVPQHGTGSAYALQCQNAWFSFTSINSDYLNASASTFLTTVTIRSTTVYEVHTSYKTLFYTLCDGHPRVITSTPTATVTTTLNPLTTTYLVDRVGWARYPDPNCTVSWNDCSGLWSRYASASSVYNSISFEKANTVVQLGSGASYWVVNGVTTTFPTPSPRTISLGTESITKFYKSGQYLIITTPPPGGLICACGKTMTAGGPPVTIENTVDFTQTPYTPSCRTEKPTCTANQRCKIGGDRVEVYWFPPQTNVTRDMCATTPAGPATTRPPTNFTWSPITTGPYTALPGNTTWFSGNVYVSLNRINAECTWSGTPVEVGSTRHGRVLTMAPSELYSLRATLTDMGERGSMIDFGDRAYSFNLNDLISPYPWSAWNGEQRCVESSCSTISGPYNPRIAVPEAIRRLDPSWATCDLDLNGLYDPPVALRSVGNIFATTTTAGGPGPAPTPGQSPPQQNRPTNTPIPPPSPGQTDPATPPNDPNPNPGNPDPPSNPSQPNNPNPPSDPSQPNSPIPGNPNPPSNPSQPNNPNPGNQNPPSNPSQPNNPNPGNQNPPSNPSNPNNPSPPSDPSDPNAPDPNSGNPNPAPGPGNVNHPGVTPAPVIPEPTTIGTIGTAPIVINPNNPSQINIGSSTLNPGGPAITLGPGTTVSLRDPGHIVISTPGAAAPSTINIPQPIGQGAPTPSAGAILTMPNGERMTATAIIGEGHNGAPTATSVLIGGTMFSVGGSPITLPNGIIVSQAPSGTGVVMVNPSNGITSTIAFSNMPGIYTPPPGATPAPTALVTIGGTVYTATRQGGSIVVPELGLTLSLGGAATTINGTVVSDAGDGTGVVVGSSTARFSSATPTGSAGNVLHTGAAARVTVTGRLWYPALGLAWGFVGIMW